MEELIKIEVRDGQQLVSGRAFVSLDFKKLEEAYKAAKRIKVIARDIF